MKILKVKIKEKKLTKYFGYAYIGLNKIELKKGMKDKTYLGTLIHELIHILEPDESETAVSRKAATITHYVWKKGFRRQKNGSSKKRNSSKRKNISSRMR